MSAAHRAALVLRALLLVPVRFYQNRQLLATMALMSDHALADIGLSRSDLADTTGLPVATEIGAFLAQRVADKRGRR